jgi:hypothetical protein
VLRFSAAHIQARVIKVATVAIQKAVLPSRNAVALATKGDKAGAAATANAATRSTVTSVLMSA